LRIKPHRTLLSEALQALTSFRSSEKVTGSSIFGGSAA
jgi:hypothetical protein